ncbi:MAG: alpha-hydroxy acid oxidase [Acidimicrobiia bacterium]
MHPGWTWEFVRSEPIRFASVVGGGGRRHRPGVARRLRELAVRPPTCRGRTSRWLLAHWDGPLVVKGIQTVADAKIAADLGVEVVALSNHGGRQLDSAPAIVDLVAPVADAVGDRVEIICDGGIRRGSDIVKAVAAGATAAMAGRAYLYGLGAAGERGVDFVLDLFRNDMKRVMALLGAQSIADLGPELLDLH